MFNDINLFHKVVYKIIPYSVTMHDYLGLYSGDSRLHNTDLNHLYFVSNRDSIKRSISYLNKSFFFRSHTSYKFLPFDWRNSVIPSKFKNKLAKYYWNLSNTRPTLSEIICLDMGAGNPCAIIFLLYNGRGFRILETEKLYNYFNQNPKIG